MNELNVEQAERELENRIENIDYKTLAGQQEIRAVMKDVLNRTSIKTEGETTLLYSGKSNGDKQKNDLADK